ncbi:MAG: hypothetical protein KDA85_15200, partial [Planctomycetaceae bacterium]|nr:hypothetical protein [Planctomycetaceae bacterium]
QITHLGEKYQSQILQRQMIPLVRDQILPIVREESAPLGEEIGRNLWNRVSLWGFTWRYLYDASPLPERHRVRKEFDRFMQDEVMPELASHSDDLVHVTERIVKRIGDDPKVRASMRQNLDAVADDPELHELIRIVLQESVVQNHRLRDALQDYLTSAEVREILTRASRRFEPTARTIGDRIFGTREGGVTPEFAEVLRVQILEKDRRWLLLTPRTSQLADQPAPSQQAVSAIPIVFAREYTDFPLRFQGSAHSALRESVDPGLTSPIAVPAGSAGSTPAVNSESGSSTEIGSRP